MHVKAISHIPTTCPIPLTDPRLSSYHRPSCRPTCLCLSPCMMVPPGGIRYFARDRPDKSRWQFQLHLSTVSLRSTAKIAPASSSSHGPAPLILIFGASSLQMELSHLSARSSCLCIALLASAGSQPACIDSPSEGVCVLGLYAGCVSSTGHPLATPPSPPCALKAGRRPETALS